MLLVTTRKNASRYTPNVVRFVSLYIAAPKRAIKLKNNNNKMEVGITARIALFQLTANGRTRFISKWRTNRLRASKISGLKE
jgi:hypothetical protein